MSALSRLFPILRWSRSYTRSDLTGDLLAGATTAVLLILAAGAARLHGRGRDPAHARGDAGDDRKPCGLQARAA